MLYDCSRSSEFEYLAVDSVMSLIFCIQYNHDVGGNCVAADKVKRTRVHKWAFSRIFFTDIGEQKYIISLELLNLSVAEITSAGTGQKITIPNPPRNSVHLFSTSLFLLVPFSFHYYPTISFFSCSIPPLFFCLLPPPFNCPPSLPQFTIVNFNSPSQCQNHQH